MKTGGAVEGRMTRVLRRRCGPSLALSAPCLRKGKKLFGGLGTRQDVSLRNRQRAGGVTGRRTLISRLVETHHGSRPSFSRKRALYALGPCDLSHYSILPSSKTIIGGGRGLGGGSGTVRLDSGETRYYTLREAATLQTFPSAWDFDSTWSRAHVEIGNAVPPLLRTRRRGAALGGAIAKARSTPPGGFLNLGTTLNATRQRNIFLELEFSPSLGE